MSDECQELKNIKYKTMLLNGNNKTLNTVINDMTNNMNNLDIILDSENEKSKKESWNRLDKSVKMNKIYDYIKKIAPEHKLTNNEIDILKNYLSQNLDKKVLQKNKEVTYIKETGILENIPTLHFNNTTRKFTLRRQSHSSALKTLGPTRKKKNKSAKNSNKSYDKELIK
tara:strand:- start:411 stop:920 length:510 start_codon:yes stop_codon:yes gene_type:complete